MYLKEECSNQQNRFHVHILVISVSVSEVISFVYNKHVHHQFLDVMKLLFKDSVVPDTNAVSIHSILENLFTQNLFFLAVQSTLSSNATTPRSVEEKSPNGCQVNGTFYEIGERIQQASGPCLQCKCDHSGLMQCDPQTCSPPAPLLLRMNRDFFASTIRR